MFQKTPKVQHLYRLAQLSLPARQASLDNQPRAGGGVVRERECPCLHLPRLEVSFSFTISPQGTRKTRISVLQLQCSGYSAPAALAAGELSGSPGSAKQSCGSRHRQHCPAFPMGAGDSCPGAYRDTPLSAKPSLQSQATLFLLMVF